MEEKNGSWDFTVDAGRSIAGNFALGAVLALGID
jgi:hypothetical protein